MKRRKFKKENTSAFFKDLKKWFFQRAQAIAVILVFLLLVFVLARAFLYRSDYFRLRAIEVKNILPKGALAPDIRYEQVLNLYRGRNIFKINLKEIARFFQEGYPDAKDVRANIVLPDKIVLNIKCRWPVAILRGERPCFVDGDGYELSSSYGIAQADLPVIDGINSRYIGRGPKKLTLNNLKLALDLLKEVRKSRYLTRFGLASIDAGNLQALSFNLANGIEIRIGSENFSEKLRVLEKTLGDPRMALDRIEYIDVRFGDAIIGPK